MNQKQALQLVVQIAQETKYVKAEIRQVRYSAQSYHVIVFLQINPYLKQTLAFVEDWASIKEAWQYWLPDVEVEEKKKPIQYWIDGQAVTMHKTPKGYWYGYYRETTGKMRKRYFGKVDPRSHYPTKEQAG